MTLVNAKAFRVTETSRELLQSFIQEPIPEATKYVLASPDGYMFFDEDPGIAEPGHIRLPKMMIVTYYEIQYEA